MTRAPTTVVTGAGRGIGRAIALRLAADGRPLGLIDIETDDLVRTADLVRANGSDAATVAGDVTRGGDVDRLCTEVESRFGPVEDLVNNAGRFGTAERFADTDIETWWQAVETNLGGSARMLRRVLPGMLRRRRGHVVTLNSRAAFWPDASVSGSAYAVSKAALLRLTNVLAGELRGTGVTVVDLSPGMVRTAMTAQRPDFAALPGPAWTAPEQVAAAVADLLSGPYDCLSGRFLHITDDFADLAAHITGPARTLALLAADRTDEVAGTAGTTWTDLATGHPDDH